MSERRHFLDIDRSLTGRPWVDRLDDAGRRTSDAIVQRHGISEIVARIIAGRGVGIDEAPSYLAPTVRDLMPDPSVLIDLDRTVDRLARAIKGGEQIALFGDYDVDGACSVALMVRYLTALGLRPETYIPDRIFEGYGPNETAMRELVGRGAALVVTLDCGTTSNAAIAAATEAGADVLVIDHHKPSDTLPETSGLVNPNRADDLSGLGNLSAAGVTFMVLVGLNRNLREQGSTGLPDLMALVDLVALSTVCDVVPLTGLNRAFVLRGIEIMRRQGNAGIAALGMAARISGPVNPYHLGFLIGPRINAGGRIGDAALGARLLAMDDQLEAEAVAAKLDELNRERQEIEKRAVEEATAAADAEIGDGEGPPIIVAASPTWHQGVVGLVAARLKERFNRPAFAISQTPNGGGTGSGRSIPGVDLGAAVLEAVRDGIIVKGGGHAMAAGITLEAGQLGHFRAFMEERLAAQVTEARRTDAVKVDAAVTARGASVDLLHDIDKAGPFGAGNANPVFVLPAHRVTYSRVVGAGGHVSFSASAGDRARVKGIAFRAAGTELGQALLNASADDPLHLCGSLAINHWQGREEVQLRLFDAAKPAF